MKRTLTTVVLGLALSLLAACAVPVAEPAGSTATPVQLTPYYTPTLTLTPTIAPTLVPTSTLVPTITHTPQIYIVKARDTLFTIAARNGLTVANLTAANPGVNAYSLYVGTRLIIPAMGSGGIQSAPTPTPAPLILHAPECVPSLTGGAYCFALVENGLDYDLENLTAEFRLTDPDSGEELTQDTFLPLTRLAQGSALPFYVYFTPPVFAHPVATFRVLSALPVTAENASIYPMTISDLLIEIAPGGLSADVSGLARFEGIGKNAKLIRLLAVAYDAEGKVVGLRRYEEKVELKPATYFEFKLIVESVAGGIARVELFGEAQP